MGKGNKGGGGGGNKPGLSFNASHTMQNEGGLVEKVLGLVADSFGLILATVVSTLAYEGGTRVVKKLRGGGQKAIGASSGVDEQSLRFGIRKSIESVADDLGRALTKKDEGAVKKAYFSFEGNQNMDKDSRARAAQLIPSMIAESDYEPDDDDADDGDGDDNDDD